MKTVAVRRKQSAVGMPRTQCTTPRVSKGEMRTEAEDQDPRSKIPNSIYQITDIRSDISNLKSQIQDGKFQISDLKFQIRDPGSTILSPFAYEIRDRRSYFSICLHAVSGVSSCFVCGRTKHACGGCQDQVLSDKTTPERVDRLFHSGTSETRSGFLIRQNALPLPKKRMLHARFHSSEQTLTAVQILPPTKRDRLFVKSTGCIMG